MLASLSSLVDNLSKIYKKGCKRSEEKRKIKSTYNFIGLKNNKLNSECKECIKIWLKPLNGLIKKFTNIHQVCNGDINKFILLLRKGGYPYEQMDSWERFNETSLLDKKAFYSELNLQDITDENNAHTQKVQEVFEKKNLGDYHDLYVQCHTLLLPDVFENLEISVLKYMDLILFIFCLHQDQHDKLV